MDQEKSEAETADGDRKTSTADDEANLVEKPVPTSRSRPGSRKSAKSDYEPIRGLADIQTPKDLTRESVRDILRRATGDHSLRIVELGELEDMSGLNDAFNSTICSLTCRAEYRPEGAGEETVEERFHFVVKAPPKCSMIRFVHKYTKPFCNEVSWYLDLVRQLELANGEGCLSRTLPRCYHASSSYYDMEKEGVGAGGCSDLACFVPCRPSESGILVLENVKKRRISYRMFDKKKPMPLGHVKLIVSQLAKFHGMWLKYGLLSSSKALDGAMPWDAFLNRYRTQAKVPKILYRQLKSVAKQTVRGVLSKYGDEETKDDLIRRCRRFFDVKANRALRSYFEAPPSPECHTLCHGDFWSNNILFDAAEDPTELIIIDYQLINYGHPCYDLVYFLYLNTDLAFRDAHLDELLRRYFDAYSAYFDFSAEPRLRAYDYEKFVADFDWHKQVGFTTACSVMPNVLSDVELDLEGGVLTAFRELKRKQRDVLEDDENPSSIEIRRRLLDLVTEMARDGVI